MSRSCFKVTRLAVVSALALLTGLGFASADTATPAAKTGYKHVLLVSVDGMHAIDLTNWVANNPYSNLGTLAAHGVVYPNAYTTAPSDSYPGMLAQVTGATPKNGGLFYDDSYDRNFFHSKNYYVSQGLADKGCAGPRGTEVTNFEELDKTYNFSTGLVKDYTGGGTLGEVYTQLDLDNMQRQHFERPMRAGISTSIRTDQHDFRDHENGRYAHGLVR